MHLWIIKRIESLLFLILLIFIISVFYPLETFSDGVDFLLGGYFLGISHPPSYPVYTQLVHLTKYIPLGNLALRTNFFTALLAFLFLVFFYNHLKGSWHEKFLCILMILFSNTFFANSINGELYVLNLLLIFLMFFFLEKDDKRYLYLNAFILGIGLGIHHTVVFMGLYICFRYFYDGRKITLSDLLVCIFFLISGATVYLYLPFRAFKEPLWNWGNPRNLILFINSFLRHDFQAKGFFREWDTFLHQLISFNPFHEFGIITGVILFGFMLSLLFYEKRFFIKSFVFILFFYFGFLIIVGNDSLTNEERLKTYGVFYLPAYVMLIYMFNQLFLKLKTQYKFIIFFISIFGLGYNFYSHLLKEVSYEKMVFPHDYARMNLSMLPRDSSTLIILGGEKDFPIIYQQKICKFRDDILIIQLNFLGKMWNLKESLKLGAAYKPFSNSERGDKGILKSVILYQKEVNGKRVFTNIFNNDELPDMNWSVNGIYQEINSEMGLEKEYFIRYRGKGGDDNFIENILKLNNR